MKHVIFTLLTLMLFSCMCTANPDSVRIVGLLLDSDTNYSKGTQSLCVIRFKADKVIEEGKKQYCLTYNKELAGDIHKNRIVPSSIQLICDKRINDIEPGQNLEILSLSSNFEIFGAIQDQDLIKNEIYKLSMNCRTTDSLSFKINFTLRIN